MTRKQQIEGKARRRNPYVGGTKGDISSALMEEFIAGAEWADQLPTAIRQVLEKRSKILREKVIPNSRDEKVKAYYQGKYDAYEQAIVLLSESIESIRVEL